MASMTQTEQKINDFIKQFDVQGERIARWTERRNGSKGFGYYTIVDVAYEGQRVSFFKSFREAQEWAQEYAEAYR